ncbi:MAG: fluoride efflux transporter CrcB [Blastocatellia bacterium]|nr:fluoride efflux transporter CrcB [Blastocatellia bacterium]
MTRTLLFVAIGGMLGSVCRYLSTTAAVQFLPWAFPVGTFAVNVVGSFVMGAAVGLFERYTTMGSDWRIFVTAGFCGGFTTFSAFAFENLVLLTERQYALFAAYSLASFVLCIAAALAGLILTRP